ncbi:RNA polymerase sigma-70 like domain [Candidatus Nanopelagicaceae bacterium]
MATKSSAPRVWTVGDLGAFYTQHRAELHAHASRVLKDQIKAEEITQDALIKFMLAAPELESEEHALSYLHRTIENLCIDLFRAEGRRPNLVVIDDAQAEVEAAWQNNGDHSAAMSAAEDAAIIRQALALLSPAERAALVMWEMEGRSTEEIAAELGIKESAVRHTVSRARASLRKVLSTLVVNEETGMTALDALSTSYKKAAELAQKSSKAALSLLLVITAFLGFTSLTGNEGVRVPGVVDMTSATETSPSSISQQTPEAIAATKAAVAQAAAKKAQQAALNIKTAALSFFGLDNQGVPTGFSVTDADNVFGKARVTKGYSAVDSSGLVVANQFITGSAGPNVLIDQKITVDGSGTNYTANAVNIGFAGNWNSVEINSIDSVVERLSNGQHLITATMEIGYLKSSTFSIPTGNRGYDLSDAPQSITTRILLNAGKTQILAQAVQILEK